MPSAVVLGLLGLGCDLGPDDDPRFREGGLGADGAPVGAGEDELALQITPSEGKADLLAKFSAAAVDSEASILSYEWDFGDGSTSTLAEPEHLYADPGAYEATLTAEIDLNHIAIGMTAIGEVSQTVYATTTDWAPSLLDLELGDGWTVGNILVCPAEVDCGPLKMRLPGAPDGLYLLRARLDHTPQDGSTPEPHFTLDGEDFDLIPPAGGESGLEFVDLKTVVVSNHELELDWDDVDSGRIALGHITLVPADGYENPDVEISASVDMGELPLTVDFDVDSNVEITALDWKFGDGQQSGEEHPSHTYETMGRFEVGLHFQDSAGVEGLATTVVTVKPSKIVLPGLANLKQFGIWSAGFRNDADEFNDRRRAELENLNVTFVGPSGASGVKYGNSEGSAASIHEHLERHAEFGIMTGGEIVTRHSWYTNDEDGQPFSEWIFDPTEAEQTLAATDWDGDGISDLEGSLGWVYLGHEMGEYATNAERTQMVNLTRQWFPSTPIYPYYGGIAKSYEQSQTQHNAGGLQEEYQVGPGDSDIIGVSIKGPFVKTGAGEKVFDPAYSLGQLQRHAGYANFGFDEPKLWVNVNLPGESAGSTEQSMWSAEQILDYARVLLSEEAIAVAGATSVESLSLRAYDRFRFDLGYGVNTEDPTQEEYGFIEQREAAKWIGSWVEQTKAGLPILIIRQPEMQQTRAGPTVDVLYGVIGEQTERVADIVVQLDDRAPVHDPDLDGTVPLEDVEVGTHTVHAHLVDTSGEMIPGTEVRVLSVHVVEGDAPESGDDGADSGTDGESQTDTDTDDESSGTGDGLRPADAPVVSGCGCSQRGSGTTWSWLGIIGLAFGGARRRRRR